MNDLSSSTPFGVGRVIQQTFALFFARFSTLFPMAFVPALALTLLSLASPGFAPPPVPVESGADVAAALPEMPSFGAFVTGVLGTVLSFFVVGFLCLVALDAVIGRSHTVGQYARQAARHILPIGVLGFLVAILTGIGALLLVVPGLYVAARFLPWVEAVVFEDAGWRGLGRAQELTEGYRWPLVGAVLAMMAVIVALAMFASAALFATQGSFLLALLVESLISAVFYMLFAIFTALVYARLREIKEGKTVAEIAASIG
ncbi:MAG: hypothetical protein DI556_10220 [Rhodovulum sulfidophilum]|uniref:Glycerophosphoryl diester phosphodiesterase membrane domain-containing protein n=1 Tax=Rhodovulum sulfidophilum TaxID=35806 RepID=A0A2W5NC69_RHOSU|nr:MAG: hypothetical protein DI556_10220 [Rhodovulum sulfidophilum]